MRVGCGTPILLYVAAAASAKINAMQAGRRNHYSGVQTSPGKHSGASQTLGSDESMSHGNGTVGNCHCGGQGTGGRGEKAGSL